MDSISEWEGRGGGRSRVALLEDSLLQKSGEFTLEWGARRRLQRGMCVGISWNDLSFRRNPPKLDIAEE